MEKYFLNLTKTEFEELDISLDDICEENEKFPGNALYYLTNALMSSHNIIAVCTEIIKTKQFPEDINCFCGCNMYFTLTSKVLKGGLLPDKEEELNTLDPLVYKALDLLDGVADKKFKAIPINLKIQSPIYDSIRSLIEYILNKEETLSKIKQADKHNHVELVKFLMNTGKFSTDTAEFFLDTFVYDEAA